MIADYCFIKATGDDNLQTVLVMRLYPYKVYFACVTLQKGLHWHLVHRIAQRLDDTGLLRFAYKCDREASINTMLEAACLESARKGVRVKSDDLMTPDDLQDLPIAQADDDDEPDVPRDVPLPQPDTPSDAPLPSSSSSSRPVVAVPELTHPGESQTNGLAERAVQAIEGRCRTILVALEARIKIPLPANHPVVAWAVEHAPYLLNRYQLGPDGRTPLGRLHSKESQQRICEFGNRLLWCVPKRSSVRR